MKYNLIKKSIASLFGCSFAIFAFAADGSDDNVDFFRLIKNILLQDLQPLLQIATNVSYIIGFFLIIGGLTRLYRHGSGAQSMMHRASPSATAMYFVSGVVLISFMPYIQMLSYSLLDTNVSNVLSKACSTATPLITHQFHTDSNNFCPMMAYAEHVHADNGQNADATGEAIKYLMFGVLFFVGVISFIRGMLQLVKIGEGGQGGGLGKAFTHIFAGIVAVNADAFYIFFKNVLENNTHS